MREIKFRGYDEENKCWRYGHLFETVEGIRRCYNIVEGREVKYYVSPESIGQYTGLHDKNGKEIYEGDILQSDGGLVGKVVFDDGTFSCRSKKLLFWSASGFEDDLTIGNIHENPELIK